jgi:hypothetical protein
LRRFSIVKLGSVSGGLVLLYLLGIFVRGQYGIALSVHNISGKPLQTVRIKVQPRGDDHSIGQLGDGQRVRFFVLPRTESHIELMFTDGGESHVETVVGYVESGYCGGADIKILPGEKVISSERIDPVFCARSWLDFM